MKQRYSRVDFLEALFGPYYERNGGFIMVRAASEFGDRGSVSFFPNIQSLGVATFPKDKNIFFGTLPREKMKTGREHVRYVTTLWATLDVTKDGFAGGDGHFGSIGEARAFMADLPLPPSIVVSSGRGLHLYWLLKEVKEISTPEVAETLLSRLNARFRCAANVPVDSTLRLPGTINQRCSPVCYCQVERLDADRRYTGTDFQSAGLLNPAGRGDASGDMVEAEIDEEALNGNAAGLGPANTMPGLRLVQHDADRTGRRPQVQTAAAPADGVVDISSAVTEVQDWRNWGAMPDSVLDEIAERVCRRFNEGFFDALAQRVADQILERLAKRILGGGGENE